MTDIVKTELTCEHCNVGLARTSRIAIEMKPGRDGIPWFLCLRCWMDGVRPMSRIGEKKTTASVPEPTRTTAQRPKKKKAS